MQRFAAALAVGYQALRLCGDCLLSWLCCSTAALYAVQVEIKTTPETVNPDVLQKAADFVHAFILGTPSWQQQQQH